jgi:hypothetical protein
MNEDYRLIYHNNKYVPSYYTIHKVIYNKDGSINKININPIDLQGNTVQELYKQLGQLMWTDKKPVIDYNTKKEIS